MTTIYCHNCGKQIDPQTRFCPMCGTQINDAPFSDIVEPKSENRFNQSSCTQLDQPKKKRKGLRIFLIIVGIYLSVALVGLGINLTDQLFFNSPSNLEEKLIGTTWYTSPSHWVTYDGSTNSIIAYSVEFLDDGTATITTYLYDYPRYEEGDYDDMEVYKTETVEWEIDNTRTLHFNGEKYKFKPILWSEDLERWYFKKDELHIERTYYNKDKWGYSD